MVLVLLLAAGIVQAQDTTLVARYTLQDCRQMALDASHGSEMRAEALEAAKLNQQAALAAMFPKISANASYMWNSKSPVMLSNEMRFDFGTARVGADGVGAFEWSETSWMNRLNMETRTMPEVNARIQTLSNESGQIIADMYQGFYRALNPDLTHVVIGQVGITQPIYVGGRLAEMYKMATTARTIAEIKADSKEQDLLVSVDEAYWRVLSVAQKAKLAQQYFELLQTMENNVTEMAGQGLATQSDLLKVKTQRGDAEVKKMQAENGLQLSKMALCQIIGLPLESQFELDDSGLYDIQLHDNVTITDEMINARSELQLLDQAEKMAKSNVRITSAGLQPNIVAQANYIYSNPSVENGFSNQWKGTGFFSAGVVVNIPILHVDDIFRLKAAKHEANIVALKRQEAKELLTLQVTQANQKVLEAQQKVAMTDIQVKNAEEILRFAQEAFAAGLATASELLQAQTAWLAACTEHVDAQIEVRMAETQYKRYTNTLE